MLKNHYPHKYADLEDKVFLDGGANVMLPYKLESNSRNEEHVAVKGVVKSKKEENGSGIMGDSLEDGKYAHLTDEIQSKKKRRLRLGNPHYRDYILG